MNVEVGQAVEGALPGDEKAPLLDVKGLSVEFRLRKRVVHAVNGFSCSVGPGETLAILGESGSGKSVTAHAIMGTLNTTDGQGHRGSRSGSKAATCCACRTGNGAGSEARRSPSSSRTHCRL